MEYGFDNIFGEGPTPTPSMLGDMEDMEEAHVEETDEDMLNVDEINMFGESMSNVDGMNI